MAALPPHITAAFQKGRRNGTGEKGCVYVSVDSASFARRRRKKKILSRESTQLNSAHSICILLPRSESHDYHKMQA